MNGIVPSYHTTRLQECIGDTMMQPGAAEHSNVPICKQKAEEGNDNVH